MKHIKFTFIASICLTFLTACGGGESSFSLLADSDTFVQSAGDINDKVDILWVVDNSGSMRTSQDNVASNFNSFINDFQTKSLDYQMAITGTDAFIDHYRNAPICSIFRDGPVYANWNGSRYTGCGEYGTHNGEFVLTPSTPNLSDVFTNNITQGISGAGDERAFQSMTAALGKSDNAGFVRSGAFLAVIILTDEDDTSRDDEAPVGHGHSSLHNPQLYIDYLDNVTSSSGATRRYSVNTIAIQDTACRDSLQDGFTGRVVGTRVNALADLSGGFKASLCGNFANELNLIAENILQLATQFYLSRIPDPDTIVVKVNGATIPNKDTNPGPSTGGWEYDSDSNSIKFSGDFIPSAGSTINVDFDPVAYGS